MSEVDSVIPISEQEMCVVLGDLFNCLVWTLLSDGHTKNNNIYFLFVPFSRNAFLSLVTSFYEYCKCMTMDAPLQLVVAIFGFIIYEEEGNKVGHGRPLSSAAGSKAALETPSAA